MKAAIDAAARYGLSHIEFGVSDGQYSFDSLGDDPAVSLQFNPRALRRYLDQRGLRVSQSDAAFSLMGPEGSTFGIRCIQETICFAAEVGRTIVNTTSPAFRWSAWGHWRCMGH